MIRLISLQIRQRLKSKVVQVLCVCLVLVMIFDPIMTYLHFYNHPDSAAIIGQNTYQYWILMNSASWGNTFYYTLFWFFPVLLTGLVPFYEKSTGLKNIIAAKTSRKTYVFSQMVSSFVFSFCLILLLLLLNIAITQLFFPIDAVFTKTYFDMAPNTDSFFDVIFKISPFLLMLFFVMFNAFVIGFLSVFSAAIQLLPILHDHISFTLILPVLLPYCITFIFDCIPALFKCNLMMILQPAATYALKTTVSGMDIILTTAMWCVCVAVIVFIEQIQIRDLL